MSSGTYEAEEDEKGLWKRVEEEQKPLNKSGFIYRDEALEAYLNEVALSLYPPDLCAFAGFKIRVIKSQLLNAFAYPNGQIYIHTGLLANMENEAQLATLLSHEMTHVTHRHTVRYFRDIKNKTAALSTMSVVLGGLGGGLGNLAVLLGQIGTVAAVTGYSRELETEADLEGINRVIAAGYDPRESVKFFKILQNDLKAEDRTEPFFFGTHPRVQERIENYEAFLDANTGKYTPGMLNDERFLKETQGVVVDNAFLCLKAGRFSKARNTANKVLTTVPDNPRVYYLMGELDRQDAEVKDKGQALVHYQRAIDLDPNYADPYKGIGLVYYKQSDFQMARKYFQRYLELDRSSPDRAYIEDYVIKCGQSEGK